MYTCFVYDTSSLTHHDLVRGRALSSIYLVCLRIKLLEAQRCSFKIGVYVPLHFCDNAGYMNLNIYMLPAF